MNSILLVDDEATICAELKRTLERFAYKVEMAHSFESALNFIEEVRFDAILVEFNLKSERAAHPRSGRGVQLIRQIRALGVTSPVLMLTAMEGEPYETASFDAGADDFILKTTSIPSLLSQLRAHMRRHEERLGEKTKTERISM